MNKRWETDYAEKQDFTDKEFYLLRLQKTVELLPLFNFFCRKQETIKECVAVLQIIILTAKDVIIISKPYSGDILVAAL